jgi:hypothetical protein
VADKLTPLIVDALTKAATEPSGVPLVARKSLPGLFPNTTIAKAAARRCFDEGWLRSLGEPSRQNDRERCAITEKGLAWLLDSQSPKAVLHDLLRILEARQGPIDQLLEQSRAMKETLAGLRTLLEGVLPKVAFHRIVSASDLPEEIFAVLQSWNRGEDCPLPELHRRLSSKPTLGAFHDALRGLHQSGRIWLHPWTGPLYAMPEPMYALLIGHEVAYYANAPLPSRLPADSVSRGPL